MFPAMPTAKRVPLVAYAAASALAAVGLPSLLAVAWRFLVWQGPTTPGAVASLAGLAAVAAVLGLLVAGQGVLIVHVRREVHDAGAAGNADRLEAAVRRALAGARLAAGAGAAVLLVDLAVAAAAAVRAAGPGIDWPGFGLALTLLTAPALVCVAAPAALVGLRDPGPEGLARAVRRLGAVTLVAVVALGAVLLGASTGFAVAQTACRPGGSAGVCGAANASIGQVVALIGPPLTLLALAVADRGLRALWTLRTRTA
jgi:hypothetical protein